MRVYCNKTYGELKKGNFYRTSGDGIGRFIYEKRIEERIFYIPDTPTSGYFFYTYRTPYFSDYFYTESELRKMKLKQLGYESIM